MTMVVAWRIGVLVRPLPTDPDAALARVEQFQEDTLLQRLIANCAETVIDALRAGGASIQGWFHYPTEIIPTLDNLLSTDPTNPFALRGGGSTW